MNRTKRRKMINAVMFSVTGICAAATVSVLFLILGYLVWHGGTAVNLAFFTRLPSPPGETGGGMANAIVGTAKIVLLATVIGFPIGFMASIYLAEYAGTTMGFMVRYAADLLNGVPSIVLGIFAYAVVVIPMGHFSALAGAVALSLILIPMTVRGAEQFLRAVPRTLAEGGLALGASKWRVIATVVVPAAARGTAAAVLLGVARIAGETAPLLFTSFSNRYWSSGFNQPIASLPVMIFTYAVAPYEDWHRQAWAAGLVLLALVLTLNVATRLILARGSSR